MKKLLMCAVSLGIAVASIAVTPEDFQQAIAPRPWAFPRDHGRHDGFKLEWWYFTGNLHDSSGRKFGYQLTFFRSALAPMPSTRPSEWRMHDLYFAHAAISDIEQQKFYFKDRLERSRPGLAFASDKTMNVGLLDWSCKLRDDQIKLEAKEAEFAIDLSCNEGRRPTLQGPGGVNVKGHDQGQASYYYSMTRLKTAGTLSMNGQQFQVDGLSWMDHEFSSDVMSKNQSGWDWMGLQLNDGSDLMIYRMRNEQGGTDYLSGTHISQDDQPNYLTQSDITLTGDSLWESSISHGRYPQRWLLTIPGEKQMTITSDMPGQELVTTGSTKVTYFEGASTVRDVHGKEIGQGYLEMTGYAKP